MKKIKNSLPKINKITGVYAILHVESNKMYIGSSHDCMKRYAYHRFQLNNNTHFNSHLQNAWNKYNEEAFELIILEEINENFLLKREQYYLDTLGINTLYNIATDCIASMRNHDFSLQHRLKIAISKFGKPRSLETKTKISNTLLGRTLTKEHRANISIGKTGVRLSDLHKEHISKSLLLHYKALSNA